MYLFEKKYNFLLIFLGFLLLVACSGREKQKIDLNSIEGNSPFRVNQIIGDSRTVYKNGLPYKFILDLKSCVKDSIRKDVSIQDVSFVVEYKSNKDGKIIQRNVETSTNEDGCIRWSEEYEYKYVTQPLWIGLSRTIKRKTGAYAGQVFVRTAVNPWSFQNKDVFPPIMDLRQLYYENDNLLKNYTYEEKGLSFLIDKQLEYPQLWASRIDVQIDLDEFNEDLNKNLSIKQIIKKYKKICYKEDEKNCFSRKLSMRLTIPLKLRTLDLKKQLRDTPINGGVYKIKAQLISQYPSGRSNYYRIHEKVLEIDNVNMGNVKQVNQKTRFLNADFKLKIPYINKNANNKIVIEIESKNLSFKKFQGIYTLKNIEIGVVKKFNIDSFLDKEYEVVLDEDHKDDKSKVINVIEKMDIKYIYDVARSELEEENKITNNPDIDKDVEKQLRKVGFNSVHLDVTIDTLKFSNVKNNQDCSTNEVVVRKTVQYVGKVCFKDFLKNNYEQTTFRVFRQELSLDGELQNPTELFKNDVDRTHYSTDATGCITFSDEIDHKNYDRQIYYSREMHFFSSALNLYGKARVAINPWQEAFQFYQDITQLGFDKIRTNPSGIDRPHLVINQFKSVNFFPTYIIDNLLNIHIFQNLYFLFQPIITRHDHVARGRHSRSIEYLRDGYYLLRLLITRSPQETKEHPRVISEDQNVRHREEIVNNKLAPVFNEGRYITHMDNVIKAQANYTNMYAPIQFNKEQLYYVGSRNRIILQLAPADPQYYKYDQLENTRDVCRINLNKTKWKPYLKHDLVTYPYSGPFNPQDWTNWNILQPSPHLKTDKIIAQSEIGKKRQFFNMDLATCNHNPYELCKEKDQLMISKKEPPVSEAILNGCSKDSLEVNGVENIEKCFSGNYKEIEKRIQNQLEKQSQKVVNSKKLKENKKLKKFALENALVIIDLENSTQKQKFLNDLNKSPGLIDRISSYILNYKRLGDGSHSNLIDYKNNGLGLYSIEVINEYVLNNITNSETKQNLKLEFRKHCIKSEDNLYKAIHDMYSYQDCVVRILRTHLKDTTERYYSHSNQEIKSISQEVQELEDIKNLYSPASDTESLSKKLINLIINPSKEDMLKRIIDVGISSDNLINPYIGSFSHSLCYFWFDSYMKKYISAKQMRASYANHIRKNDYLSVLESDQGGGRNKKSYFQEVYDWIPEDESIKKCHNEYSQCILSDYCKERNYKKLDVKCKIFNKFIDKDESCNIILKKHCGSPSVKNDHLCKTIGNSNINLKQCNQEVTFYCENNGKHPLCYNYRNRCLINYHDCTENYEEYFNEFSEKDPFNVEKTMALNSAGFLNIGKRHPLKTCLADPHQFFEFENKVIVEEINDNQQILSGYTSGFSVSSSISVGSYLNWTSQRTTGMVVKAGTGINAKVFNLGGDISMGMSSNEANSSRRARDVRLAEGVFLLASKLKVQIGVTKYKKCLTIRPKVNAFLAYVKDGLLEPYEEEEVWKDNFIGKDFKKISLTRSGLIICNPSVEDKMNPLYLSEDYYYITQGMINPNNSQFLNLYDIINRPFVLILRSRREFIKLLYILQNVIEGNNKDLSQNLYVNKPPENQFINYSHPVEEMVGLKLSVKDFNETGFYDGIYTYPRSIDDLDVKIIKKNKGLINSTFDTLRKNNFFSIPTINDRSIPVQQ